MQLLTIPEVARVLRVRPARVYELARQGLIPTVRLGRQVRVQEEALHQWIADGGQALSGGWRGRAPGCPNSPAVKDAERRLSDE